MIYIYIHGGVASILMQKKNMCFFTIIRLSVALNEVFAGNIFSSYAAKLL